MRGLRRTPTNILILIIYDWLFPRGNDPASLRRLFVKIRPSPRPAIPCGRVFIRDFSTFISTAIHFYYPSLPLSFTLSLTSHYKPLSNIWLKKHNQRDDSPTIPLLCLILKFKVNFFFYFIYFCYYLIYICWYYSYISLYYFN